jgi:hypothetical protein
VAAPGLVAGEVYVEGDVIGEGLRVGDPYAPLVWGERVPSVPHSADLDYLMIYSCRLRRGLMTLVEQPASSPFLRLIVLSLDSTASYPVPKNFYLNSNRVSKYQPLAEAERTLGR